MPFSLDSSNAIPLCLDGALDVHGSAWPVLF